MMVAVNGSKSAQDGSVLVIALLLLLILTILGVASMSGTVMQERMAGNVNLQTLAFNAASAGVATSVGFADPSTWGSDTGGNARTCLRGGAAAEWKAQWTTFQKFEANGAPEGTTVAYRQRVGCFEPENAPAHWDDSYDVPLQLLVLNQGVVCSGDGVASCGSGDNLSSEVLSVREVEVRVETRGGDPDCLIELGPVCPANLPCTGQGGGNCPIQMPASGQGGGDGSRIDARPAGCPLRTSDQATTDEMFRQLRNGNDRTGWYQPQPAVRTGDPDPFWTTPSDIAIAANAIKIGVRGYEAQFEDENNDEIFKACQGRVLTGNPETTCPNEVEYPITYIAGNLNLNASGTDSCRVLGSVLVENELRFNGNVSYEADFILMGGRLDINGMGGNVSRGLIKLFNLQPPNPLRSRRVAYDPANTDLECTELFNISGMGNSQVRAEDCKAVQDRWINLNVCLDAVFALETGTSGFSFQEDGTPVASNFNWFESDYNKDIDGQLVLDPSPFAGAPVRFPVPRCEDIVSGGGRDVIASWREYLDRERW